MLYLLIPVVAYFIWSSAAAPTPLKQHEQSFTLYYWHKCGYCTKFMPEFNKLGSRFGNTVIRKVEASQNKEYPVDSYPTMIWRDGHGDLQQYMGERSASAIKEFLSSR